MSPADGQEALPLAEGTDEPQYEPVRLTVVPDEDATGAAVDSPSHRWTDIDYIPGGNDCASAAKLADSAIAPLVAAARGYETIHDEALADAYGRWPLPRRNTAVGKRFADLVQRGDLLLLPWFDVEDVRLADRAGRQPKPVSIQIRPARAERDEDGRERPYEFVSGHNAPIGMHPSIPTEWIDQAPSILVTEGLLNGDSALTAYAIASGAGPDDLAWTGGTVEEARARLHDLLDAIPEDDRVLILTVANIGTLGRVADWRTVGLSGREVWLSVDAALSADASAFRALSEAWEQVSDRHRATPHLLCPIVTGEDGPTEISLGNYLSTCGTWESLLIGLADALPQKPPSNDAENVGRFRINNDKATLEECEAVKDDVCNPDVVTKGRWAERAQIGGRILSIVASRTPTNAEIATGILDESERTNDAADQYCEVEISWVDAAGAMSRHVISGPATILNYAPDQWDRHKARIPAPVLACEHWPPPRKYADEWLRAVKANAPENTRHRIRWESMGWVPVKGGVPAYIIGDQVIGEDDNADADIFAGIGEDDLSGAGRFGVGELDNRRLDEPEYAEQIRGDIEKVMGAFLMNKAFTDRKVASTLVAAALRPALPIRPTATVFIQGPAGRGKSASAASMMGFWSRSPGDWTNQSLPGAAKDTPASMELAVARTPVWVVDDLAPSPSRIESEQEQKKIADLVRNVYNGAGKRRSNASMGSQKVHPPRAMLVVTAENELQIASARDRCITLDIGYGALSKSKDPTDAIDRLCYHDGAPARVTQALIKYLRDEATSQGWAAVYKRIENDLKHARGVAARYLERAGARPGDLKRHADMAGDVAVSIFLLRELAEKVGVSREILDLLTTEEMVKDVCDLVSAGHHANNATTPGRALIEAVAGVLSAKQAHIVSAVAPGSPPTDDQATATMLGWEFSSDGTARPKGVSIGWYVVTKEGERIVLLNQKNAFSVAARKYPHLVPPGQGTRSSWHSVVGEGLVVEDLLRVKEGSSTATFKARCSEGKDLATSVGGVPIALELLLAGGDKAAVEARAEAVEVE